MQTETPASLEPTQIGALLRLLAHDLRNPLAALDSNLAFLEVELDGASHGASESFEDVKLCCDGLTRLVDGLEVLGRFLQGKVQEEASRVPFGGLVAQALRATEPSARSHGVELPRPETFLGADFEILVGREMFSRALRGLLQNAIQHAPAGSSVSLSYATRSDAVVLRVEDGGAALDAALARDAFTAAGQLRAKSSRGGRYSGGLGLFCARVCAEASGARLEATPSAAGNVFELSAPR